MWFVKRIPRDPLFPDDLTECLINVWFNGGTIRLTCNTVEIGIHYSFEMFRITESEIEV